MIVYHGNKERFNIDVINNTIADKIKEMLKVNGIIDNNQAEYSSWNNSMNFMNNILLDKRIPNEADISIEYQIPQTCKRVDFIITGSDESNKDNVVIIELKQWTKCEKINDIELHSVKTYVGGNNRTVVHPSYQAYSYAAHIKNYSQIVAHNNIELHPCAYLHNFKEEGREVLNDPIYDIWVKEAPFFLQHDCKKLQDFIAKYISKKSNNGDLLYEIDSGKIRPAKALQDCIGSMLRGNEEFKLMDEQITIYDKCKYYMNLSNNDHEKRVMIIQGGPGTGKSVLAINLLSDLIKQGLNAVYVTKNSAPRNCYTKMLSKDDAKKQVNIKETFRSPYGLCHAPSNFYDCLIIDEAHRLVKQMYGDFKGQNQIKECINASLLSIFFIDEDQRITTKDIGNISSIKEWARNLGVKNENIISNSEMILYSQFRCNGSDGFISFVDSLLEKQQTANNVFDLDNFDFKVYDNPNKMREDLRILNNKNNKARMVAGYAFDWNVKNDRGEWDIELEDGFKAKWNLANDKIWAINKSSFDQVGCIHTCQGVEFDYVGVIIGKDLIYRNNHVEAIQQAISKDDGSSGIRTCKDKDLAIKLIKNTYKVLLTRGQKGCFVYCEDKALSNYIKSKIRR